MDFEEPSTENEHKEDKIDTLNVSQMSPKIGMREQKKVAHYSLRLQSFRKDQDNRAIVKQQLLNS